MQPCWQPSSSAAVHGCHLNAASTPMFTCARLGLALWAACRLGAQSSGEPFSTAFSKEEPLLTAEAASSCPCSCLRSSVVPRRALGTALALGSELPSPAATVLGTNCRLPSLGCCKPEAGVCWGAAGATSAGAASPAGWQWVGARARWACWSSAGCASDQPMSRSS